MANQPRPERFVRDIWQKCSEWEGLTQTEMARRLKMPRPTLQNILQDATNRFGPLRKTATAQFVADPLPRELPPIMELLAQRIKTTDRHIDAWRARNLIDVHVKIPGPIGIVHFGDPHVDDNGCALGLLKEHVEIIQKTDGLFAANIGDTNNNWMGRLARLWGKQSTSEAEAWALTEWFVGSLQWLYFLDGNHGAWSGEGDPVKWMLKHCPGVHGKQSARLSLKFPTGKTVRINARHDFSGHSMWNSVHGNAKAAKMGWRDHIIIAGHKHVSGYGLDKDPSSGLISHLIRVAGYKFADGYAEDLGLPNANVFPSCVTIIDPRFEDDDPRLITTLFDVETGAEYLSWLRKRK